MFVALFDLLVLPTWQGPLRSTFIDALRMGFSFGSVRFSFGYCDCAGLQSIHRFYFICPRSAG